MTCLIYRLSKVLTAMVLAFALAACVYLPPLCPPPSALEAAASYDWMLNDRRYSEPLNSWVKNERLEALLLKDFRSGGIASLGSRYGFECSQRLLTPICSDCYTCRGSLPKSVAEQEAAGTGHACHKAGEMLIRVDAGPGRNAFSVMTYWKREELGPDAGKF